MKLKLILFLVVCAGCFLSKEQFDVVRKTPKVAYETPPNCVWLRGNLFIDQTEIRNMDYVEFLYWTDHHAPEQLPYILPDTLVWRDTEMYNEPFVVYYLRHPAYRDYPVVGVSYEQAIAYCKWRSDRVNEFIYLREHNIKGDAYKPDSIYPHPEVMRFRLPAKEEWQFAAAAGLSQDQYPYGYERLIGKNGMPVCNTIEYGNLYNRPTRYTYRIADGYYYAANDGLAPVTSFSPNKYGIYNMTGNVSEIIADSCFKGLNYSTSLDGSTFKMKPEKYIRTDSTGYNYDNRFTFRYRQPQSWLGFRCVCEVLK